MRPRRDSQAWETGGKRARAHTPRVRKTKVKGPFTLTPHSRRLCGSSRGECGRIRWVFLRTPEPPEARTGSLGEISEEGGTPAPLTALTRGQREVLRAHLSGKGLIFDFADPKLPEASAGFLGEECGTDGIPHPRAGQGRRAASPLTPDLVIFSDSKPPEACARTLGEG
ncbi:hypothetical protein K523DRAFT_342380 [Schizophyllum commune Tattone D]|nr:hypothetical protein K523DRAFT_342380 [Schizophyllum commune Tattone D]